jgi:periplasmic protein TonB
MNKFDELKLQTEEPENPFTEPENPNEPEIPQPPPIEPDPYPVTDPIPEPNPEPFPTPPEPIPDFPPDVVF